MNEFRRYFLFYITFFLLISSACSLCKLPTAWFGSWYQRGMNSLLEITSDHIQTKGLCLDVLPIQQYYLFTDRLNPCTRCLLFIERHINLLQYRESECIDSDVPINITSCQNMIAPDAALYTLHRNNSKSELCPIQPPFLITNLIRDNIACLQSILSSSYINECANDYQFHLHLTPCISYQSALDFQFICVGTWIVDFHTYFVTRIISHSTKRQRNHINNQYACFSFLTKQKSSSSSSLVLHMATDDSCHDLYSKHISTIITLSSKNNEIINESCLFPQEYQLYEWYSINQTIQMIIKDNNIKFLGLNKRFTCQKIINLEKSLSIYQVRSYTNCQIKIECLHIIQRTTNVLELYTVNLSKENNCYNNNNYNFYLTLLTKSYLLLTKCPNYLGHLIYQSNIDYYLKRKSFLMSIGCDNNKEKIIISKQNENNLINHIDTCLASWISNDHLTTYIIAQSIYSNASYCLSFQMKNPIIIRNNSNECLIERTTSIYSAYRKEFCSKSIKLSCKLILLLLTIFII